MHKHLLYLPRSVGWPIKYLVGFILSPQHIGLLLEKVKVARCCRLCSFKFSQQSSAKRARKKRWQLNIKSGRGGENKRCQIESLATCVPRTLQIETAFTFTGSPTMEARSSIVHSATSHSAKLVIWKDTPSFTVGRNRTSAHNATFQPIRLVILDIT